MISHTRSSAGLKPTWKGNLLSFLIAMLVSASILVCFHYRMTALTRHEAQQIANMAKLPNLIRTSRK